MRVRRLMLKITRIIAYNRGVSQGVFGELFAFLLKFFLQAADARAKRRFVFLTARLYKFCGERGGFVAIKRETFFRRVYRRATRR